MLSTVRRQIALTVAAIGAAITLLGNLDPFFTIAGWARFLVEHWRVVTFWIWDRIFALVGLQVGDLARSALTFFTFMLLASLVAARVSVWEHEKLLRQAHHRPILRLALALGDAVVVFISVLGSAWLLMRPHLTMGTDDPILNMAHAVGLAVVVSVDWLATKLFPHRTVFFNQALAKGFLRAYVILAFLLVLNYVAVYGPYFRALLEPP